MSTKNPERLSKSRSIRTLIQDVGLPLNKAPEALGMKASEFLKWWTHLDHGRNHGRNQVRTHHLRNLANYLHIEEAEIYFSTYDREFVRKILFFDHQALPEKYSQNPKSFLRSSAHIIEFLRITRGQHFADSVLRKLNISPALFLNLQNQINFDFFLDLLDCLASEGFSEAELENLSAMLFLSIEKTPLGEEFRNAKSYFECFEVLSKNIRLFDRNFHYQCSLDTGRFELQARFFFDEHPHREWPIERLRRILRYRKNLVGWFPFLSQLPPLAAQETHLGTQDGFLTTYVIEFQDEVRLRPLSVVRDPALTIS